MTRLWSTPIYCWKKYPLYNKHTSCNMGRTFHSHACIFSRLWLVKIHMLLKYFSILYADSCYKYYYIINMTDLRVVVITCWHKCAWAYSKTYLHFISRQIANMQRCSCHKTIHFLLLSSQISSDIIKRCVAQLSLDDIFDGFVERSRKALEESICCCQAWKDTYSHLSGVHNKHSPEEWVLDESSIFAHIDAFIQRCKDLLEVVEGQVSIRL